MKSKLVKLPKKYKDGFRIVGLPTVKNLLWHRFFYPKWIFRPVCWIKGHKNKIFWAYGVKVKQCIRCGKYHYKKETREKGFEKALYKGEFGEIYQVKFMTTKGYGKSK